MLQLLPDWVRGVSSVGNHHPAGVPREHWCEGANWHADVASASDIASEPDELEPEQARFKNWVEHINRYGR